MNPKPEKSAKDLLLGNETLQNLVKKTQYLQQLHHQVQQYLPEPLKHHCLVANLRESCLVIQTDSAAWATQLRYLSTDLLTTLRQIPEFCHLRSIQFYVR